MSFEIKHFVINPATNDLITIRQLSDILKCDYITAYNRVMNYNSGRISIDKVFKPINRRKTPNRKKDRIKPELHLVKSERNIADRVFVFRPECISDRGDIFCYSAYDADDPTIEVLSSIVESFDGSGWMYNCYPFGIFETRNELVREYLRLKLKAKCYDPSPDFIVEEYIDMMYSFAELG